MKTHFQKKSRTTRKFSGAVLFALAGCLLLFSCGSEKKAAATVTVPVPAVKTAVAQKRSIALPINASGTFVAMESSEVAPEIDGTVAAALVEAGAFVATGAPLIRIQPASLQFRLDQALAAEEQAAAELAQAEAKQPGGEAAEQAAAKANWDAALADYKLAQQEELRAANLLRSGDVSRSAADRARANALGAKSRADAAEQQYRSARNAARQDTLAVSRARAGLQAAKAQSAAARKALNDTVVRAPFAGYVSSRLVSPGEYVSPQTKVAVVERIHPIRLLLQVGEARMASLKTGDLVRTSVAAYASREFFGKIAAVHPTVNSTSRALIVEARFDNPDGALRPGMFGNARIEQGGTSEVVVIPASAIDEDKRAESRRVWVIDAEGRVRMRLVQLHSAGVPPGEVFVVDGVKPGERVVTAGGNKGLFDGAPVKEQR